MDTNPALLSGPSYAISVAGAGYAEQRAEARASFTCTPPSPLVGEVVTFVGHVVTGTAPFTYTWAFGDGDTATGAVVSHTYGLGGDYPVTMSATNACGREVVTRTISIRAVHFVYLPIVLRGVRP